VVLVKGVFRTDSGLRIYLTVNAKTVNVITEHIPEHFLINKAQHDNVLCLRCMLHVKQFDRWKRLCQTREWDIKQTHRVYGKYAFNPNTVRRQNKHGGLMTLTIFKHRYYTSSCNYFEIMAAMFTENMRLYHQTPGANRIRCRVFSSNDSSNYMYILTEIIAIKRQFLELPNTRGFSSTLILYICL